MTVSYPDIDTDNFDLQRTRLQREIAVDAAATAMYTGRNAFSSSVMSAMGKVDRHRFVPEDLVHSAYGNYPLPIGKGQTISQPYIVALMTDLLDLNATDNVLEVGTGSGYQTAILAELVDHVYSIEVVESLGVQARSKLQALGYTNVSLKIGNGCLGWPEHAPYNGIIVTAAPENIPDALTQQLKPGGKIVIPLGPAYSSQELMVAEKQPDGSITTRDVLPVRFVPLKC